MRHSSVSPIGLVKVSIHEEKTFTFQIGNYDVQNAKKIGASVRIDKYRDLRGYFETISLFDS